MTTKTKLNYTYTSTPDGDILVTYDQVLGHEETQISIQGIITGSKYIEYPNDNDEYVISFGALTLQDSYRLSEHIESWIFKLEYDRLTNPWESVEVKNRCHNPDDGSFQIRTRIKPKLNCEIPDDGLADYVEASFNLFLRNGPDASIYLCCSYIDFMDTSNGLEDRKPVVASDDDNDF